MYTSPAVRTISSSHVEPSGPSGKGSAGTQPRSFVVMLKSYRHVPVPMQPERQALSALKRTPRRARGQVGSLRGCGPAGTCPHWGGGSGRKGCRMREAIVVRLSSAPVRNLRGDLEGRLYVWLGGRRRRTWQMTAWRAGRLVHSWQRQQARGTRHVLRQVLWLHASPRAPLDALGTHRAAARRSASLSAPQTPGSRPLQITGSPRGSSLSAYTNPVAG